jgi:hypothetical protein
MSELMAIFVSIPNFEALERSAAPLVPWGVRRCGSSSAASFEDQAGSNAGYGRMLGAMGLAVPSGLGRRETHPGIWLHVASRGH